MLKRFWRAVLVAALGIVVAGVWHTSGIAMDAFSIVDAPLRETALRLPGVEPGTKVVAAALADIDADGDLDLIASDGTLDLLVWSNDGSGHFTRKYPVHAPSGGRFSRDGTLDLASGTMLASVLPGGSAPVVAADRASRALDPCESHVEPATSSRNWRPVLTRASRAPPHTLRSA
jgi:hypothetical protein